MRRTQSGAFTLAPLPYPQNALEPYLSAMTLEFHYGKHHHAYLHKLNELVAGTPLAGMSLEEVIRKTAGDSTHEALFNNAAQVWNHTFYWNSLSPAEGKKPSGELGEKIASCFQSYENFVSEFAKAGTEQFGSGWVWLVQDGGQLKIIKTANADNPMSQGQGTALLALDVWEHAYYLDFQNRRSEYLTAVLGQLINWTFAAENLGNAQEEKELSHGN